MKTALASIILAASLITAQAQIVPGFPSGSESGVVKKQVVGQLVGHASGSNTQNYTVAYGSPGAGRYIACEGVVISSNSFVSLTIGGGGPTTTIYSAANGVVQHKFGIALVPTGTTGTVTTLYGTPSGTSLVNCYSIFNVSNPTSPLFQTSTATFSPTLALSNGAFVIGSIFYFSSSGTASFTNLTSDISNALSVSILLSGSKSFPVGGSTGFTLTMSGGSNVAGIVGWAP